MNINDWIAKYVKTEKELNDSPQERAIDCYDYRENPKWQKQEEEDRRLVQEFLEGAFDEVEEEDEVEVIRRFLES